MEQRKRAYEAIAVSICRIRSLSPKRPVAPSIFDEVLESIDFGISAFTPHDLRRTASTLLHEMGYGLR
jgi:integrase